MLKRRHSNSQRHRDLRDHPAHRKWVRGHFCSVPLCPETNIECAHVDYAGIGPEKKFLGGKCADWLTIPLCSIHHAEQHSAKMGWRAFEAKYGINAENIAHDLARRSPRAQEMREAREQLMEQAR